MPFFIYDDKMAASLFDRILGGPKPFILQSRADQLNPRKLLVRAYEMVGWRCSLLGCVSLGRISDLPQCPLFGRYRVQIGR